MIKEPFTYTSIHHYLDIVLSKISNPTNQQIKEAKKAYWRLWYRNYRKEQRILKKEFTLRLDEKTVRAIEKQKGKATISTFLHNAVVDAIGSENTNSLDRDTLGLIHQNQLEIINLLEELEDTMDRKLHTEILNRLSLLEGQIACL